MLITGGVLRYSFTLFCDMLNNSMDT